MKHLKPFYETADPGADTRVELLELSRDHLAYLLDDTVEITVNNVYPHFYIEIFGKSRPEHNHRRGANWNAHSWSEIKDHFIPFIKLLDRNWVIDDIIFLINYKWKAQYISDITRDLIDDDLEFTRIRVKIISNNYKGHEIFEED